MSERIEPVQMRALFGDRGIPEEEIKWRFGEIGKDPNIKPYIEFEHSQILGSRVRAFSSDDGQIVWKHPETRIYKSGRKKITWVEVKEPIIERPTPVKENENKGRVLITGDFGREDIEVIDTGNQFLPDPNLKAQIEEAWAPKAAKGWFPGPLVRIESVSITKDGKIKIISGETNFKDYTGSRDLESLKRYHYEGLSNPLSCSIVVITKDGKMLIGHKKSGDATGSIDAIGGYAHPKKDRRKGEIDFFATARREIVEETGLHHNQIRNLRCLGISYEYKGLCHPVASFVAKTNLTSEQVLKLKGEEIQVMAVEPSEMEQVLKQYYPNIEPDGRITIALANIWNKKGTIKTQVLKTISEL